jgi:formylmethanofuran dehydrogenase subunit C
MNAITFKLKIKPQQSVDCSPLTPTQLNGKSIADIATIELKSGKQKLRTETVFDISGENTGNIVFKNSCDRLDCIGKEMNGGSITVHGDTGAYLGLQMRNGQVAVYGSAGAFAASGMNNGRIYIHGNAGDFLASAIAGDKKGMSGGLVIITGNVGDRAGDQLRRGTVLIEGNTGSYCGSRMLAGTIGVLGNVGDYAGYGMRRGTLLLTQMPTLHPTIQDCGAHTLPFLSLMFKSFAGLPTRFAEMRTTRVRRYAGDLANNGKGEILVLQPE